MKLIKERFFKCLPIFFCICVVLLVASVFLNYVFLLQLKKSFIRLQHVRIFPMGFVQSNLDSNLYLNLDSNKKKLLANKKSSSLLFIGDSRVEMWDTKALENELSVTNIGHGGQTTAQIRFQTEKYEFSEGDWMIMQGGINDLHPIGAFPKLKPLILANCKKNISAIVKRFRDMNYKVILTTIFPPGNVPLHYLPFWDENTPELIFEINSFIKHLSAKPDVYLLDAYELLKAEDNRLGLKFEDPDFFLHANSSAYSILNRKILEIIRNYSQGGF
jgi:hypothetical protein